MELHRVGWGSPHKKTPNAVRSQAFLVIRGMVQPVVFHCIRMCPGRTGRVEACENRMGALVRADLGHRTGLRNGRLGIRKHGLGTVILSFLMRSRVCDRRDIPSTRSRRAAQHPFFRLTRANRWWYFPCAAFRLLLNPTRNCSLAGQVSGFTGSLLRLIWNQGAYLRWSRESC